MRAIAFAVCMFFPLAAAADDRAWPPLPETNATAALPAQDWAFQEGLRAITAYVY